MALTVPAQTRSAGPGDPDLTFQHLWQGTTITVCCFDWRDEIAPPCFEVVCALDAKRNDIPLTDAQRHTLREEASRVKYIRDMDALRGKTKPLTNHPT